MYQPETGQYSNQDLGIARGAAINYPGAVSSLKQTVVADAMLKELTILVEKASMIYNRHSNLRDRIFGAAPGCP